MPGVVYRSWLGLHWHYAYIYRPGFVHLWGGPGVMVYRNYGAIPYGHSVVINRGYRPSGAVINNHTTINRTTITGPSTTVRPGAGSNVQVGPNNTQTVRPGGPATFNRQPAVTAPTSVTPPRAAPSAPSTFNRPGVGAPSTFNRPTSVTPPRAAPSAPSMFNRPSVSRPSYSAPSF